MNEFHANPLTSADRLLHDYFQEARPRQWPQLPAVEVVSPGSSRVSGRHLALAASLVACFLGLLWFSSPAGVVTTGLPEGAGPATARRPKAERPALPAMPSRPTPLR